MRARAVRSDMNSCDLSCIMHGNRPIGTLYCGPIYSVWYGKQNRWPDLCYIRVLFGVFCSLECSLAKPRANRGAIACVTPDEKLRSIRPLRVTRQLTHSMSWSTNRRKQEPVSSTKTRPGYKKPIAIISWWLII